MPLDQTPDEDIKLMLFRELGEFVYEFSQLEYLIRHFLADALNLGEDQFDAVTSPYDFAALCRTSVSIWQSLEDCTSEQEKELEGLKNEWLALNDERVRVVHGTWLIQPGLPLARHVSRGTLQGKYYFKTPAEVAALVESVKRTRAKLMRFFLGPVPPLQ